MRAIASSLLLAAGLSACASTSREASPEVYYAKAQMTAESYRADQVACLRASDASYRENKVDLGAGASVVSGAVGLAGAPFGLAASALMAVVSYGGDARAKDQAVDHAVDCLETRGYALQEYSAEQSEELATLEGPDRNRRALQIALAEAQGMPLIARDVPPPQPLVFEETPVARAVAAPPLVMTTTTVDLGRVDHRGRKRPPVLTTN